MHKLKTNLLLILMATSLFAFGQNQNLSKGKVFDGEPYLAINPYNSQHIVVAWMGWIDFTVQFKIKTKASFDGGKTWSPVSAIPHAVPGYTSADPSIDFNQNGDVFVCYIDFTGTSPPVTGGVYVCKSSNGGLTWETPLEVINTNYDGTKWPLDRPWINIDRSAGPKQGAIYVTSMNLNRDNPPYNPYLSVSLDTGKTFTTRYLDTTDWVAGSINPLALCSPTLNSKGVFYGAYPSYVIKQSLYAQTFLAISNDAGKSLSHKKVITFSPPTDIGNYPSAKKANLLLSNPADENHLVYLFLSAKHGDLDVYLIESKDAGDNWTKEIRINDDPIGNNRMQEMLWGDFDADGDLVVSWRDRRNGEDSTYQCPSEIWAACRSKNSTNFSPNFELTSESVDYDTILENSGNDFMCIKLLNDTIHATWGDTRDGRLNIWYQNMTLDGKVLSLQQISSTQIPTIFIYPNPTTSIVNIEAKHLKEVELFDIKGVKISSIQNTKNLGSLALNLEKHASGQYWIKIHTEDQTITKKIIKK